MAQLNDLLEKPLSELTEEELVKRINILRKLKITKQAQRGVTQKATAEEAKLKKFLSSLDKNELMKLIQTIEKGG